MGDIGRTGRRLTLLALMGLVAVLAFWAFFGSTSADYVGSEKCNDCHEGQYDAWRDTMHGIDFATEWEYGGGPTHKYTMRGEDEANGTFGPCGSCHVTGEGDTDRGGTNMEEPWNSPHNLPLGSIGCENCHMPGSDHVDSRDNDMDLGEFAYSLSCAGWSTTGILQEERMGSCHDGGRMGGIEDEDIPGYYMSGHAGGVGPASPKGNPGCYHCMAADGFISVTIEGNDAPEEITYDEATETYFVDDRAVVYGIYCGACHDPHPEEEGEHFQLRAAEDEICELCHYNTHVFPDTHVRHPTTEFRKGINGKDVPQIDYMPEVSCPECHMYGTGHRAEVVIVGHSFDWVPQACVDCHSMYTNETALEYVEGVHADYDAMLALFGDGETGLLAEVHERHEWAMEAGIWTEDINMTYLEAEWNYEYPYRDGSRGAHNPAFMKAMWESSLEKFEEVLEATEKGRVMGTLTWEKDSAAIEGANIKSSGMTLATTDAEGKYEFIAPAGTWTVVVEDAEGNLIGSMDIEATTMENVTKDMAFTKATTGDGDGDGDGEDDEGFDTMHYAFIGIIVLLIIILIVVSMMGKKSE